MDRNDGLWVFIGATLLRIFGLVVDYGLMRQGWPTVTELARRNEWLAFLILAVECIGVVGLGFHFFSRNGGR